MTTTAPEPTALRRAAVDVERVRDRAVTSISVTDAVRQSFSLAGRGVIKMIRNPEQLFDVLLQPIIFTLMFTYIFGGAISGNVHDYLPVIIPGILVQTVIVASTVTGSQLREDMNKGVFDRFRSLPIARISPLAGALLADVIRYLVATAVTVAVGVAMGWRPDVFGVVVSAVLILICSFAVSWIFALMGCLVKKASAVQGISMMIMFPLTFMSNAFVPVDTMPGWLQGVVNANPVSHLVSAVRELCNDGHIGAHALWSVVGAAVIVAVFAPLAVRTYIRTAR